MAPRVCVLLCKEQCLGPSGGEIGVGCDVAALIANPTYTRQTLHKKEWEGKVGGDRPALGSSPCHIA